MAENNAFQQAYTTGQAPDLARALADLQYRGQQSQNYEKQINAQPKTAGEAWLNVIPTLMRDYQQRKSNNIMQEQVIPAQQSLAAKLQAMADGNDSGGQQPQQGAAQQPMQGGGQFGGQPTMQQPQRPMMPQNIQEAMQRGRQLKLQVDMNVPGSEAAYETWDKSIAPLLQNAGAAGGSLNPQTQQDALARNQLVRDRFATMVRNNPNDGRPELINQVAAQQSAAVGQPVPMGAAPYVTRENPDTLRPEAVNPAAVGNASAGGQPVPMGGFPQTQISNATGQNFSIPTYQTRSNDGNLGVPLNASPANRAQFDAMRNEAPALSEELKTHNNTLSLLDNIDSKADLSGGNLVTYGRNVLNKYLTSNNNADLELLKKDIATVAAAQGGAGGGSTDAARALMGAALPNYEMQPNAVRGATDLIRKRIGLQKDMAKIKINFINQNQNNPNAGQQYSALNNALSNVSLLTQYVPEVGNDVESKRNAFIKIRQEYPQLAVEKAKELVRQKMQWQQLKQQFGGGDGG